jgi:hypothetical protein
MNETLAAHAHTAHSLFSLLGLWLILVWLYADFRLNHFRQSMIGLRDRLFVDAAGGMIDFDHPAYTLLRTTMNGFIRFAHRLSLFQMVTLAVLLYFGGAGQAVATGDFSREWSDATSKLPGDVQKRLAGYRWQMNRLLVGYVIPGAEVLAALLIPMIAGAAKASEKLARILRVDRIDSVALAAGRADGTPTAIAA